MGRLFGTDGIRGVVGKDLSADTAFRLGRAVAELVKDLAFKQDQKESDGKADQRKRSENDQCFRADRKIEKDLGAQNNAYNSDDQNCKGIHDQIHDKCMLHDKFLIFLFVCVSLNTLQ